MDQITALPSDRGTTPADTETASSDRGTTPSDTGLTLPDSGTTSTDMGNTSSKPLITPDTSSAPSDRSLEEILTVTSLTKMFGGVKAQDNISFSIEKGIVCGLIGPNGAGKTTLFNMITGIYAPDDGEIRFKGKIMRNMAVHRRVREGIARTFQHVELFGSMTLLENVLVGMHVRTKSGFWGAVTRMPWVQREEKNAREKALELIEFTGLSQYRDRPAGDLPIGRQKMAEIARALASDPSLLLLDEPAAGLNAVETEALGRLIVKVKEKGITMMLVEHDMNLAMGISDKVIVLDRGRKLAQGTPREVQNNQEVMEAYLGQG